MIQASRDGTSDPGMQGLPARPDIPAWPRHEFEA